jgi:hypothetical protein
LRSRDSRASLQARSARRSAPVWRADRTDRAPAPRCSRAARRRPIYESATARTGHREHRAPRRVPS